MRRYESIDAQEQSTVHGWRHHHHDWRVGGELEGSTIYVQLDLL